MLSNYLKEKNIIYSICENSEDISPNTVFKAVKIAKNNDQTEKLKGRNIILCGNINEREKIFRTEDGRYYFSICEGWGIEGDTLYGLEINIFFDFGHSTTLQSALAECRNIKPSCSTWGGAMSFYARKSQVDIVKKTIENLLNA